MEITAKTPPVAPAAALPVIRDPRIYLAMPVYGKIDVPFVQCLLSLLGTSGVVQVPQFLQGDSLVNRARNNLVMHFLGGMPGTDGAGNAVTVKHDWLLFLDTDLVFRPEDIERLYRVAMKGGVGIYAGAYPMKKLTPKVVFNNMPGCKPDAEGLVEVREAGTGFMLIHREVFERMIERFRDEIEFVSDTGVIENAEKVGYDFFTVGVYKDPLLNRKRFLSEDWYFCQRWRALGGKIVMHTGISCNHIGQIAYPGDAKEIMEAADAHRRANELMAQKQAKPILVKVGPPEHFESPSACEKAETVAAVD